MFKLKHKLCDEDTDGWETHGGLGPTIVAMAEEDKKEKQQLQNRIDKLEKAIKQEIEETRKKYNYGYSDAKDIVKKERLHKDIEKINSIDDIKQFMHKLVDI